MNKPRKIEAPSPPLVVDLDGTLTRSDLLVEAIFAYLGRHPIAIFALILAFFRGKAALKAFLAEAICIDAHSLPYDEAVLSEIKRATDMGRKVYLISASNERYVRAVAEHLGMFDGYAGSTPELNLGG